MRLWGTRRVRVPWDCRCHDPGVFGHLAPCVYWETQPRRDPAGMY